MSKIPVFDIGDTLSPSKEFSIEVFRQELQRQGFENPPEYPYEGFNEMDKDSIQKWFDNAGIDANAQKAVESYKKAKKEKLKELGIFELLREVEKQIGKPGIISDNRIQAKKFYENMFKEENIDIDGFVVSEEIGVRKPEKEIFTEFLERRDVEGKDCVYFGNNIPRDSACKKVGMDFVLVEQFKVFGENWECRKIEELTIENVERECKK